MQHPGLTIAVVNTPESAVVAGEVAEVEALGTVDSWQETEAWNLVSLGDARLVATTGGGVTVCRSRVRLTLGPPRQSLGLAGHELVVWVGALGSGCV